MTVTGAEMLARYAAGPLAGHPAVTRHEVGRGSAWYLSTELDEAAHDQLIAAALAAAGLTPEAPGLPPGVEAVRRRAAGGRSWLFLLNHTSEPATVPASGVDLLTDVEMAGSVELPPGGVAVIREVVAHRDHDFGRWDDSNLMITNFWLACGGLGRRSSGRRRPGRGRVR
jgi:beta-galactosidase